MREVVYYKSRIAVKLEIKEIRKKSRKSWKSGNFAKFSGKIKFPQCKNSSHEVNEASLSLYYIIADATLLMLTYGSIDRWTDLISSTDLFAVTAVGDIGDSATITKLISRIKQGMCRIRSFKI